MNSASSAAERLDPAFRDLVVNYQPISLLVPRKSNPRTHSKKQIRQIADSIRYFGFNNPILIDNENQVIAGHGRLEAAKLLRLTDVPVTAVVPGLDNALPFEHGELLFELVPEPLIGVRIRKEDARQFRPLFGEQFGKQ